MVKNPGLVPGRQSIRDGDIGKRRKGMAEIMRGCWMSCANASEATSESDDTGEEGSSGNDNDNASEKDNKAASTTVKPKPFVAHAIIANPPSFAYIHCAEKLGIPLHLMFTLPWSPTSEFPQTLANIKSSPANRKSTNKMSYTIVEMMTWEGLGSITSKFREETLDLPDLSQAAGTTAIHRLRIPYTTAGHLRLFPSPITGAITLISLAFISSSWALTTSLNPISLISWPPDQLQSTLDLAR